MKSTIILTLLLVFGLILNVNGQNSTFIDSIKKINSVNLSDLLIDRNPVKYVYCELVGTQKLLSNKVTVAIDYGEETKFLQDTRVRDEQTGKVKSFNSMVDALNYMGNEGWEFVQAYIVTFGQQNVYHWLLKKRV